MNITVVRSGGFAGLRRTWRVVVDDGSSSSVDEWLHIVDACPWADAIDLDGDGVADRFIFAVTVEPLPVDAASTSQLHATLPETRVVGPWRLLIDRVQASDSADT